MAGAARDTPERPEAEEEVRGLRGGNGGCQGAPHGAVSRGESCPGASLPLKRGGCSFGVLFGAAPPCCCLALQSAAHLSEVPQCTSNPPPLLSHGEDRQNCRFPSRELRDIYCPLGWLQTAQRLPSPLREPFPTSSGCLSAARPNSVLSARSAPKPCPNSTPIMPHQLWVRACHKPKKTPRNLP